MFENNESYLSTVVCPLVDELKRLKKSSSEAVDNDEEFSPFKMYMHIHRSLLMLIRRNHIVLEETGARFLKQIRKKACTF